MTKKKKKSRAKASKWLLEMAKLEEQLEPCPHCGRVVLVGWCCTGAKLDAELLVLLTDEEDNI
jgi:ribosomal protein L32